MKRKSIENIILIIKIIFLFLFISVIERQIQTIHNDIIEIIDIVKIKNYYPYQIFLLQFIIYCLAGMIFGVEKLISERNKNGFWRINLHKLISFGVPSFLFGSTLVLSNMFKFSPYEILNLKPINFNLFTNFMQMFFGHTIITSFYKTDELQ